MKRRALIIGNSGNNNNPKEYLEGVKKDVANYHKFLKSNIGGNWYEQEIILSLDETKKQVINKIEKIKNENPDLLFVLFSGHGSYSKLYECRKLYLFDEHIYEKDLTYITDKQVTILDTCAGIEDDLILDSITMMESKASFEDYKTPKNYRILYQNAVMQCPSQQVVLYSSSIDESSQDDSELGGYFAYNLLKVAQNNKQEILNSKEAYFYAKKIVQEKTKKEQNPQCSCIKSEKILPFSIGE